jgi:hypothetical protein
MIKKKRVGNGSLFLFGSMSVLRRSQTCVDLVLFVALWENWASWSANAKCLTFARCRHRKVRGVYRLGALRGFVGKLGQLEC